MYDRTIFYALIAILVISMGWWLWADLWKNGKQIRVLEQKQKSIDEKFKELEEVDETYDVVKERYNVFLEKFDSLKVQIPDRDSFVNVLEEIRKIAEKQNVQIKSFSPIVEDSYPAIKYNLKFTGKHIERYPIQLQVLGDYLTIGAFLEEIITLPSIVNIRSISFETELEVGGILACEIVLYAYMFLETVRPSA